MKTKIHLICLLLLLAFGNSKLFSQNIQKFTSADVFQTSFFIENKGQYKSIDKSSKEIDFYTSSGATNYYLTKDGMHIIINKAVPQTDVNNKEAKKERHKNIRTLFKAESEMAEEENKVEYLHEDIELHWLNTNPNPTIETEQKSGHYFSYGNEEYMSYGFKKVTYKNIYKFIDLVYEIGITGGVKYSLILHPGAKLEDIQYEYKGDNLVVENRNKSLIIKNPLEDLFERDLNCFRQ